jgi:ferritin-like metal-binding protein YciE
MGWPVAAYRSRIEMARQLGRQKELKVLQRDAALAEAAAEAAAAATLKRPAVSDS